MKKLLLRILFYLLIPIAIGFGLAIPDYKKHEQNRIEFEHFIDDELAFKDLEYKLEDNTIYLRAISDGHTTTGNIHGNSFLGTGYVHGKIEDNYKIYYAFVNENGETVIKSLTYNDSVHIYEEGDNCKPRIVIHKHYKSYKSEYNNFYNEYYTYDIFIPSIVDDMKIDME